MNKGWGCDNRTLTPAIVFPNAPDSRSLGVGPAYTAFTERQETARGG